MRPHNQTATLPELALDRIADRIRCAIEMVGDNNGVLHRVGDRLLGPQPPQEGTTAAPAASLGALSEIDGLIDTLLQALRTNADQAHRFGVL